jgi:serine/threonine protein kinase
MKVQIADFGFSCRMDDIKRLRIKCGTPSYFGPEVLRGKLATEKVDIFAIGSLLYNLLTGEYLFKGKNQKEIVESNKQGQHHATIQSKLGSRVSKECLNLLQWMVHPKPEKRPSAELCTKHVWF